MKCLSWAGKFWRSSCTTTADICCATASSWCTKTIKRHFKDGSIDTIFARSSSCVTTSGATWQPREAGLAKILEIRVSPPRDALDRFEAAWNRLADGAKGAPLRVLSLEGLPAFVRTVTPA